MYNLDNIKLNEQIKKYRESRNISVTDLGKLISKSKSTVSKYETGNVIPDIMTLLEICNALNIELNELIPTCEKDNIMLNSDNFFNTSKLYFYYYTQNHLVTSTAELINYKNLNVTKVRFYNGIKNINKYPVIKKGIMSISEIHNIHDYDSYLKISKDDLNKIKYNNAWILNDSNYDDLFFNKEED